MLAQVAGVLHQLGGGIGVDPQTGVHHDDAFRSGDHRVAIELGYFGHFLD